MGLGAGQGEVKCLSGIGLLSVPVSFLYRRLIHKLALTVYPYHTYTSVFVLVTESFSDINMNSWKIREGLTSGQSLQIHCWVQLIYWVFLFCFWFFEMGSLIAQVGLEFLLLLLLPSKCWDPRCVPPYSAGVL